MATSKATGEWKDFIDELKDEGILSEEGVLHALLDHRTTHAQNAFRQLGEFLFYAIRENAVETRPFLAHPQELASQFKAKKNSRKGTSQSKATELTLKHITGGVFDAKGLATEYAITSGKRTTWMAIYYTLREINPQWAKEWQEASPLAG